MQGREFQRHGGIHLTGCRHLTVDHSFERTQHRDKCVDGRIQSDQFLDHYIFHIEIEAGGCPAIVFSRVEHGHVSATDILKVAKIDALITDDYFTEYIGKFGILEVDLLGVCVKRYVQISRDDKYLVCCIQCRCCDRILQSMGIHGNKTFLVHY